MRRFGAAVGLLLATTCLAEGRQSLVVRAGDEVRLAVQYGEGWSKPFLYPVMRPGWSDEPAEPGAYVVLTESEVAAAPDGGDAIGRLPPTARVGVTEFRDGYARVPDHGGWVRADDLVPERALAVRTLAGAPLPYERKNASAYDHPHHKGVWIGVDSVGGRNWWFETDRVRTVSVEATSDGFVWENEWMAGEEPLLRERTEWTVPDEGPIRVSITLANGSGGPVTFGDTKEGLLAVRVPDDFREKAGGELVHADGSRGEAKVWGRESEWMTYTGDSRGTPFGITLIDHPSNFRPSRYHARGYGLFSINPFGPHKYSRGEQPESPVTLQPGEEVRLTYGLWIHRPTGQDEIEQVASQFRDR